LDAGHSFFLSDKHSFFFFHKPIQGREKDENQAGDTVAKHLN